MRRARVSMVAAAIAWAVPAAAQDVPEDVAPEVQVDAPGTAVIGDVATVSIRVIANAGDDVAVPEQSLEPFEILETTSAAQELGDGRKEFSFQLGLLALEVGDHEVGPVEIRLTTAGGELEMLEAASFPVSVSSLIANEPNPEFKSPTKPLSIEQPNYTLAWIAGALLAMVLGGLLTWLFLRWWRKRERPAAPAPPPVPPWEIAIRELRDLEGTRERMVAGGATDDWVDNVSDVLRKYLGDRFGFDGLESTTDEISTELRNTALVGIEANDATRFLSDCDLVKFAKAQLAEGASRELITEAFRLVEQSRPAPARGVTP